MKHMRILERAWEILWSYWALWIFGIILAITSVSGSSRGSNGGGSDGGSGGQSRLAEPLVGFEKLLRDAGHSINQAFEAAQPGELEGWMVVAIILGCLLALILVILFTIGRFVSQTALIRMVDHLETSGEKVGWRQGWRLGWSRPAWRLFLVSLLVGSIIFFGFLLVAGLIALPGIVGGLAGGPFMVVGVIITIALAMPVILVGILVAIAVSLVMEIVFRACVMDDLGVLASIRHGWRVVRENFLDVGLMWLLTLGIRIGLALVLIPVVLIVAMIALMVGGIVGGLLYLPFSLLANGWILPAIVGGTIFIAIIAVPLTFVGGLEKTYLSTTWTLTYRELRAGPAAATADLSIQ